MITMLLWEAGTSQVQLEEQSSTCFTSRPSPRHGLDQKIWSFLSKISLQAGLVKKCRTQGRSWFILSTWPSFVRNFTDAEPGISWNDDQSWRFVRPPWGPHVRTSRRHRCIPFVQIEPMRKKNTISLISPVFGLKTHFSEFPEDWRLSRNGWFVATIIWQSKHGTHIVIKHDKPIFRLTLGTLKPTGRSFPLLIHDTSFGALIVTHPCILGKI